MPRTELQEWPLGAIQFWRGIDGVRKPQSRCLGLAPGVAFYWMGPICPTFLARKSRAATKWRWDTHTPETSAPFLGRVIRPESARRRVGNQQKYKKARSGIGAFFFERLASLTIRP